MSFWRAAEENHALMRANLTSETALLAAQDEIASLNGRLLHEAKGREFAELGRGVAERAERATREKLAQEANARQASEAERERLASRLEAADADLFAAHQTRDGIETALQSASTQLVQSEEARKHLETAWQMAEYKVITITGQLNQAISARNAAQTVQAGAANQAVKSGMRRSGQYYRLRARRIAIRRYRIEQSN
jgi:chromosome segregation ATPase